MSSIEIFTIGHSTHEASYFINLLTTNQIDVIADVRSVPYSRYNPQFNREDLQNALECHNIRYEFFGQELGARISDMSFYKNGRVQYDLLAERKEFKDSLDQLKFLAKEQRIALMCSEKEPLICHRTILVAHELFKEGINVVHIHSNGSKEGHCEALDRLVEVQFGKIRDLFKSQSEEWEDALKERANRIAYKISDSNFNRNGAN